MPGKEMLAQENSVRTPQIDDLAPEETELPQLWIGFVLSFAAVSAVYYQVLQNPDLDPNAYVPVWIVFLLFAPWVYWLYCVKKFHDAIWAVPGYNHPISPNKAVAFHFIPFFNIYWAFRWPSQIARFVNWRMQSTVMRGWVPGLLVLFAVIISRWVDTAGLLLLYGAGVYIARRLRRAFRAPAVPEFAMEKPGVAGPLRLDG